MGLRRIGVVVAVLAMAGVSGCSGEAEKPSELVTASSPPASMATASPTSDVPTIPPWPVLPTYPDAARRAGVEGARSGFEYFLVAIGYGFATGGTRPLKEISWPECGYCSSVGKIVQSLDKNKRLVVNGEPRLRRVTDVAARDSNTVTMKVVLSQQDSTLMQRDGAVVNRQKGEPWIPLDVTMIWLRDKWLVFSVFHTGKS